MIGYYGILDMMLVEFFLQIKGLIGYFYFDVKFFLMDGKKINYGCVDFVIFGVLVFGNVVIKGLLVKLIVIGVKVFVGFYRVGELMNLLLMNFILLVEKVCYNVIVDVVIGKVIGDDFGKGVGWGLFVIGVEGLFSDEIDFGIVGGFVFIVVVLMVVVCCCYVVWI